MREVWITLLVLALLPALFLLILRVINPPTSSFMRITAAQLPANQQIAQQWVDWADMASCMPLAAVAGEDQTFVSHHGFVWPAISQAFKDNARGGAVRGASTISQQTAKNLFLWPGRSYIRKGIEAYITFWMELLWPKARILEVYLNIAQFGPATFGVEAAARRFFHTSAAELDNEQCAALAAVLPAPKSQNPAALRGSAQARQQWIVQQMQQLGRAHLAPIQPDK